MPAGVRHPPGHEIQGSLVTIYIVSGFMRSGTSCMMRALEAGGIEAVFNPSRDTMNDRHGDEHYKVNDDGFYELTRSEYLDHAFPENCRGKVVKCLWGGMLRLKAGTHKHVIFMRRSVDEIGASYEAAFGEKHAQAIPELNRRLDEIQDILRQRRDVTLHVIQYHDVIHHPLQTFRALAQRGIPINYLKSAATVKPQLYRHRA